MEEETKKQHSPTPWSVWGGRIMDANGHDVGKVNGWWTKIEQDALNTELIVRSVNARDVVREALDKAECVLLVAARFAQDDHFTQEEKLANLADVDFDGALAAIRKAQEGGAE